MHLGVHFWKRGPVHPDHARGLLRGVDMLAYGTSILGLIFTLDQVRLVWVHQNATGVSLLTWIFFALSWVTLFLYAGMHNDRGLALASLAGVLESVLIVIGVLLFG